MNQDQDQLRLLSIFHYIVGGIMAVFSCLPMLHIAFGVFMIAASGKPAASGSPPPVFLGWIFVAVGGLVVLTGWAIAGCIIAAGRFLAAKRRYLFCVVVAAVECMFMPFGTVLGVLTIIVLMRDSVKALFAPGRS